MKRFGAAACCALAVVAAACTVQHRAGRTAIAFNIAEDPHSLDPLLAQTDDEQQLAHLMFDPLLDIDARGRLQPALAVRVPTVANGGVSRDGRTVIYHLRHGVRWQDGAPFTSRDVRFTWLALMDPRDEVPSTAGYDRIADIETPGPYTVVVRLSSPWAPAVATYFAFGQHAVPIVPAHLLEGRLPLRSSGFDEHPVGTGPYRLAQWQRGDHLTFEANPSYYRGRPKTSALVVREVPDPSTDLAMLRAGDLDWSLLSPAQRLDLRGAPLIRFVYAPFAGFGAIAFDCRKAPFDDVRLRRAVAAGIDRDRMSRLITGGQYPVTDSDQPRFSWAYDPSARLPRYDPTAADRALDALGWVRGSDGVRRKAGAPLALTFATFPEGDTAVRTAVFVQSMLRERGIAVTVKRVTVAQFYLPASEGGVLLSGGFDMAYVVWRTGADPDDSEIVACRGPADYAGYCSADVDALEARALADPDPSARARYYAGVQGLLARDVPYLFLYAPTYGYAVRDDVDGLAPTPFSPTWNSYVWSKRRTTL